MRGDTGSTQGDSGWSGVITLTTASAAQSSGLPAMLPVSCRVQRQRRGRNLGGSACSGRACMQVPEDR